MRTVSFVDNIEFEYTGNLSAKALALGDLDNDKCNELVVGNTDGEVLVFKGNELKPWRKCTGLGMITCLEIGNICSYGTNYLVTLTEEGWCHIFGVTPESQDGQDCTLLKPLHKQRLPANSKCLIIADIDGDGLCELVVGYTDRRVRSFRWTESGDTPDPSLGVLQGKLVALETWLLAGQLGSITLHRPHNLMVSQPGATFVTLYSSNSVVPHTTEDGNTTFLQVNEPSLVFHPLGSARARNAGVTTEIVADISTRKTQDEDSAIDHYSAICTLDGTITLVDDADNILWSLYVHHQLFTLTKLDVTGDGSEEVVACSWDGQTYLVNYKRDVVRFQFQENVAAFCAGQFAADCKKNVPCLVYATFNNKIKVFKDIKMSEIGNTTLLEKMKKKPGLEQLMDHLNCEGGSANQVRQLYKWCLYGFHPKPMEPTPKHLTVPVVQPQKQKGEGENTEDGTAQIT